MKTIFPDRCSSIRAPSSRVSTNWAVRLTSSTASQSSSRWATAGLRRIVPALLTRISGVGPSFSASTRR